MFNFKKKSVVLIVVALLILTAVSVVFAAGYDLTTVPSDATINGAIFQAIAPSDPTGSGGFDAFLTSTAKTKLDPALRPVKVAVEKALAAKAA